MLLNKWLFSFQEEEEDIESMWLKRNDLETEEFYRNREAMLRCTILDPVLERMHKNRGDYDVIPTELYSAYCEVEDQFARQMKGSSALFANLAYVLHLVCGFIIIDK